MRSILFADLTTHRPGDPLGDVVIAAGAQPYPLAVDALRRLCEYAPTFVAVTPDAADHGEMRSLIEHAPIAGVALIGCRDGSDVQQQAARLAVAEAETGRTAGVLEIIALVGSTPAATFALGSLVGASTRLRALVFDGASLAAAVPPQSSAFAAARGASLLAARAAGVPAYIAPAATITAATCHAAVCEGFAGLLTRSAADLPIIQAAPAPDGRVMEKTRSATT